MVLQDLQTLYLSIDKKGYDIDSISLTKKTRFGRNTTIAQYTYVDPPQEFIQEMLWQKQ